MGNPDRPPKPGRACEAFDLGGSVAAHFGLGVSTGPMTPHQYTSFRTWRLETVEGSYLVKEIWESSPPYWQRKAQAMTKYEQEARRRGICVPRGLSANGQVLFQIDDVGAYKVYDWLEHDAPTVDERLAAWLGLTLARLHDPGYYDRDLTPASDWFGLFDRATWVSWLESARERRLDWCPYLRDALAQILEISSRVAAAWESRSDRAPSHGDLEPYNVLETRGGFFLIDWESVGWESPSLELGRTMFVFGEHDLEFSRVLLDSYVAAGGRAPQIDESFGMRAVARKLGNLTELVRVGVDAGAPTGWMRSSAAIPQAVDDLLLLTSRSIDWSARLKAHLKSGG